MKKFIYSFGFVLFALSAGLVSCNKDEATPDLTNGTYKITIDNSVVLEGSTTEVGMYENNISLSEGDELAILIANVPVTIGSSVQISGEAEDGGLISITGKNILLDDGSEELYFSFSGTLKRESGSKISFSGNCQQPTETASHTFSGTVESDAFKVI